MSPTKKINNTKKTQKFKIYNRVIFIGVVVFGVAYLIGVNDLSIKNYMLLEERRKANMVRNEINQLEVKAMSLNSFNNLSPRITGLSMVKVDQVKYLNANPAVAKK